MAQAFDYSQDVVDMVLNMTVYEIPIDQISAATGLSSAEVLELRELEEFKSLLAARSAEDFERGQTLNDGWDAIEAKALGVVADTLEWNQNPDYALKAAMVANKAQRRNNNRDHQIPANLGARAVINLTTNFISKIGNMQIEPRTERVVNQKQNDMLNPKQIEQLLESPEAKTEREVERSLKDFGMHLCLEN